MTANKLKVFPEDTTLGSKLVNNDLKSKYIEHKIKNNNKSHRYNVIPEKDLPISIIVGRDNAEKELPLLQFPIVINLTDKDKVLVTDLRKHIIYDETQSKLEDMTRNLSSLSFELLRTIFTKLLNSNDDSLALLHKYSGFIYSHWLTGILSTSILNLNPIDKINVLITVYHYYKSITANCTLDETKLPLIAHSCGGLFHTTTLKAHDTLLLLNDNPITPDDLIDNIKITLGPDSSGKLLDTRLLYKVVSNTWHGPNNTINLPIAIEHIPTWMAILYTSIEDKAFKRSIVNKIITGNRQVSSQKEFIAGTKQILVDNLL